MPVLCAQDRPAADRVDFGIEPPEPGMDPPFTRLELLVIGIGRRDPLTMPETAGRFARLRRWLFGIEAPRPFADPRLEALRVLAVALRRRGSPAAAIAAARAADISPQQIAFIQALR